MKWEILPERGEPADRLVAAPPADGGAAMTAFVIQFTGTVRTGPV